MCVSLSESSWSILASQKKKAAASRELVPGEQLMAGGAGYSLLFARRYQQYPGAGTRLCSEPRHPVEWSQCQSPASPSQRGSREQLYAPRSTAVSLLGVTEQRCVRYNLLSRQASAGLLQQVSWGCCPICLSLSAVSFDPCLK